MVYRSWFRSRRTTENLRKPAKIVKISNFYKLGSSIPAQSKHFVILAERKSRLPRIALFRVKTRVCLIYFVKDCLLIQLSASNLPQLPSKFIYETILVNVKLFTQFELKIRESKLQKRAKFCLNWITTLLIFWLRSTFSILSFLSSIQKDF